MSEQEVTVEAWSPVRRGLLRGYITVTLPSGVRIHGIGVLSRDGYHWATPPNRMRAGPNHTIVRHHETGRAVFMPVISFANEAVRLRFERSIIDALLRVFPHALDATDGDVS